MSFGWTAATWVAIGTTTVAAGTAAYSADANRKGLHEQQDALKASQEEDARKSAEAETGAMVAANVQLAEAKRRRRASTLATGSGTDTLGEPAKLPALPRAGQAGGALPAAAPATSVLGGGASTQRRYG